MHGNYGKQRHQKGGRCRYGCLQVRLSSLVGLLLYRIQLQLFSFLGTSLSLGHCHREGYCWRRRRERHGTVCPTTTTTTTQGTLLLLLLLRVTITSVSRGCSPPPFCTYSVFGYRYDPYNEKQRIIETPTPLRHGSLDLTLECERLHLQLALEWRLSTSMAVIFVSYFFSSSLPLSFASRQLLPCQQLAPQTTMQRVPFGEQHPAANHPEPSFGTSCTCCRGVRGNALLVCDPLTGNGSVWGGLW